MEAELPPTLKAKLSICLFSLQPEHGHVTMVLPIDGPTPDFPFEARTERLCPIGAAAAGLEVTSLVWCQLWVRIGTAGCGCGAQLFLPE